MESTLHDREFFLIRDWIYKATGISLADAKKALVETRLARRVRALSLKSYEEYFRLVVGGTDRVETQTAIDLLTTNETYFFREPGHFSFLRGLVRQEDQPGREWRIWSAASSSGEEAYSLAMTMADALGDERFEVVGSDISTRVLEKARRGVYPMERMGDFPPDYLKRFCLRGDGPEEGNFLVDAALRDRVSFVNLNLNQTLPEMGSFDVIFLRNVLIYFDIDTKRRVIERVCRKLVPGGRFIVSHSESLHGIAASLAQCAPSIYRMR